VYRKIATYRYEPFISSTNKGIFTQYTPASVKSKNALNHLSDIFRETLLEEHKYAGIFIDKDFDVKQTIGNFKSFPDFPEEHFHF
jgi:two-component system CheB/CheR fusion protein